MECTSESLYQLTALQRLSFLSVSPEDEGIKRRMMEKIFELQKKADIAEFNGAIYTMQISLNRLNRLNTDQDHIDDPLRENALIELYKIQEELLGFINKLEKSRDDTQQLTNSK